MDPSLEVTVERRIDSMASPELRLTSGYSPVILFYSNIFYA
jgi:hypothetical protein